MDSLTYSGRDLTLSSLTSAFNFTINLFTPPPPSRLSPSLFSFFSLLTGPKKPKVMSRRKSADRSPHLQIYVLRCPPRFKSSCFSLYHEKWRRRRLGATLQDLRQPCSNINHDDNSGRCSRGPANGTMAEALHNFGKIKCRVKFFSPLFRGNNNS